jgi:hypothetical protein
MAPGPERPDAAKGDRQIAGRHGIEIGHPRRSLFRSSNAGTLLGWGEAATSRLRMLRILLRLRRFSSPTSFIQVRRTSEAQLRSVECALELMDSLPAVQDAYAPSIVQGFKFYNIDLSAGRNSRISSHCLPKQAVKWAFDIVDLRKKTSRGNPPKHLEYFPPLTSRLVQSEPRSSTTVQ